MHDLQHYEDLFAFLTSELAEVDSGNEEPAINNCVKPGQAGWYRRVIKEGHALLKRREFPWQDVGDYANRDFMSEDECREWLSGVIDLVERRLSAVTAAG